MLFLQGIIRRVAPALVLTLCVVNSAVPVVAQDPPAVMAVGLNGLLTEEAPANILDAIESLPETWKDWGFDLRADLNALHSGEDKTIEAQRARLAALRQRAHVIGTRANDPAYYAGRTQLSTLAGRLSRWLDLLEASLDTVTLSPGIRTSRLQEATQRLARSAQECDGYLKTVQSGDQWGQFLQVAAAQAVGGSTGGSATLAAVPARLKADDLTPDQKSFARTVVVANYAKALEDYVALAANVQAGPDNDPVRKALSKLLQSYARFQLERTKELAIAVRQAYDEVRATAFDGGARITAALTSAVFNYNSRLIATEYFLNRIASDCRAESGGVDDCILGAKVDGCQTTVSRIHLDLLPSPCDVRWDITVNGTVNSDTQGVKCIATVYTHGTHYYTMQKRVIFNGDMFYTEGARIAVQANNQTVGAKTKISFIPILGRIADNAAISQAQASRPESEAITRQRVASRAVPRMNYEVDGKFGPNGTTTQNLQQTLQRLANEGLYPDSKIWTSTDTEIHGNSRTMNLTQLGGSIPTPYAVPVRGLGLQIHDSLADAGADRIGVQGQTMTDVQFREHLEAFFSRLLNRSVNTSPLPKDETDKTITFKFDENDPIRVRFDNGQIIVSLKADLQREGDEPLPRQIITIRFYPYIQGDKLIIDPQGVRVDPASGMSNAMQVIVATRVQTQLRKQLKPKEYDRVFHLNVENKQVPVTITSIEAIDGWMIVTAE